MEDYKLFAKYPFLKNAKKAIKDSGITLEMLLSEKVYEGAHSLGKRRVLEAIEYCEIKEHGMVSRAEYFTELLSYPIAKMLVAGINEELLKKRYALSEAVAAAKKLQNEDINFILYFAKEFALEPIENVGKNGVGLHFSDFLKNTVNLRSSEWKLVNQVIEKGFVILPMHKFIRILQEVIRRSIEDELAVEVNDRIKTAFGKIMYELKAEWDSKRKIYKPSEYGKLIFENLPPCIKYLISAIQVGENISHQGRFALTAFLHTIGMKPDEIMNVFAQCPDFDTAKTKYQVEHITGRISGTVYTPPECSTMRTYGICKDDEKDDICEKIRHPLSYYRIKGKER